MLVVRGSSDAGRVQAGLLVDLAGAAAAVLIGAAVIGAGVLRSWRVPLPEYATPQQPAPADASAKP
jgi:hypothetical protein